MADWESLKKADAAQITAALCAVGIAPPGSRTVVKLRAIAAALAGTKKDAPLSVEHVQTALALDLPFKCPRTAKEATVLLLWLGVPASEEHSSTIRKATFADILAGKHIADVARLYRQRTPVKAPAKNQDLRQLLQARGIVGLTEEDPRSRMVAALTRLHKQESVESVNAWLQEERLCAGAVDMRSAMSMRSYLRQFGVTDLPDMCEDKPWLQAMVAAAQRGVDSAKISEALQHTHVNSLVCPQDTVASMQQLLCEHGRVPTGKKADLQEQLVALNEERMRPRLPMQVPNVLPSSTELMWRIMASVMTQRVIDTARN